MTGPGTVLWSLVCSSARYRSRWSAACTWWHMCVRQQIRQRSPCTACYARLGLDDLAVPRRCDYMFT